MNLRKYIRDPYDNIISFYIKTEKKENNKYYTEVYTVIDRSYANCPYYDIQWDNILESEYATNIFKAILNHKKLVKKWKKI